MAVDRRKFVQAASLAGAAAAINAPLAAWARSGVRNGVAGIRAMSGTEFDLEIQRADVAIDGEAGAAILINGQLPAPLIRWREGDEITMRVTNHLHAYTSIHWHGILLPPEMDGVPGLSFPGIAPGETFEYRFPIMQAGTYWYHSHSGLQEQLGHYGPIVIEAKNDPVAFDREYVVVLSDWTFENPHQLFAKLKKKSNVYNRQRRTLADLFGDIGRQGVRATLSERNMWGRMRMDPTDLSDVTAATYRYLVNGHGVQDNWTGLFEPGERVRLRFVNAAAMTIFNVRIDGLPMTLVQSDGLDVQPLEIDEFQIGVAETFDVVVRPEREAYTLIAETNDRSGFARATLAVREGLSAAVPPLRPRPLLTMRDMAMAHDAEGGHGGHGGHSGHQSSHGAHQDSHSGHQGGHSGHQGGHGGHQSGHSADQGGGHGMHGGMDHSGSASAPRQEHDHVKGPGVVGLADVQQNRLHEPPLGLEDVPHRVLTYADMRSLEPNPDTREPEREIELHLTGNMERYMWSFDGVKLSEADDPIVFYEGERLRVTMVNDTMMPHPIHLHGMFFELVNGGGPHKPRKHTVVVKPGERLSFDVTADAVGDWAFHCHLLYHMHAGMMQVVSVRPRAEESGKQA